MGGRAWNGAAIRHLGIHTSRVKDGCNMRQLDMFDVTDYEKLEKMDAAVDRIQGRHGIDSLKRAVLVRRVFYTDAVLFRQKVSTNGIKRRRSIPMNDRILRLSLWPGVLLILKGRTGL